MPCLALPFLVAPLLVAPFLAPPPSSPQEAPARELSRRLTSAPRLAGTSGSRRGAELVARELARAGWRVELDERRVLLSYPRRTELAIHVGTGSSEHLVHRRVARFDPDAVPPGDVPLYNAFSGSGRVRAPVVDVGRGLRDDYERLALEGFDVRGRVALARYGGAYRGVKAELAQEFGCAALLLFDDPAGDGAERGPTWPRGPWKPGWAGQRGSIAPLVRCPGDPSTPGWASPPPGVEGRRLPAEERDAHLPSIPCTPVGADEAAHVLAALAAGEPVEVELALDVPRELRTIVNVVAWLDADDDGAPWVLAGNHRDAWVRGAQDAGSGTVSLLLAARHLGERRAAGWSPPCTLVLGFWDAEEFGLTGSTEWGEAREELLRERGVAYVNADAVVSGLQPHVSGTPGLLGVVGDAMERVPDPTGEHPTLRAAWEAAAGEEGPRLGLPGSGSDFTVFLHHLSLPVLDVSFSGNGGGQYHTVFDDFPQMDRFLDPTWEGHETAGRFLAELLGLLAERGRAALDTAELGRELARHARRAAAGREDAVPGLSEERAERLARAFEALADAPGVENPYAALAAPLPDRPWYRNPLWAPGLETGYAAETWPTLRAAARGGEAELARAFEDLAGAVEALSSTRPSAESAR